MSDAVFSFLKPAALFSHIADFLLGIPLAMLLYSAAFTLSRREISRGETFQGENSQGQKSLREDPYRCGNARTELLSRRSCEKLRQEVKFLPLTMSAAVFCRRCCCIFSSSFLKANIIFRRSQGDCRRDSSFQDTHGRDFSIFAPWRR